MLLLAAAALDLNISCVAPDVSTAPLRAGYVALVPVPAVLVDTTVAP